MPLRLLFAEDDRQLLTAISRGLREAGYEVDQATDGAQALSLARENEYEVIILDVLMPKKDGLEVCRAIRESGSRVPILMLTALDAVDKRISGLDAGADDYLSKPFDFGELLARLRALTRRHREKAPTRLVIGDLEIDSERHTVRRGGREITLTAREFTLLQYLAQNVGRVVSRAELMEHVWDDTRNTYSNIIDVYAGRLRRKIDEGERDAMFATVRGVGFRLDAPSPAPVRQRRRPAARRE
jgi:two-component system, OmpR family, copper resistance phosphate regulon response regulator CusR